MADDLKRRYSRVHRRIWNDARFCAMSSAPPNGQTLFLRLLTGPELTCIPGLFSAGEAGLAEALGWSLEGFREAFGEAFREGLAKADWKARLVWIPKAIYNNRPESPNVVRSWRMAWDEMPECALKAEAYQDLKAFMEGLPKGFQEAFAEAIPKALPESGTGTGTGVMHVHSAEPEGPSSLRLVAPSEPAKPKRSRAAPKTRTPTDKPAAMTDDWKPDEERSRHATDAGLDLEVLVAEFREHWISEGKRKRRKDWMRTFANRIDFVLGHDWLREKYASVDFRAPSSMAIPTGSGTNQLPPLEDLRPPTPPELGLSDEPELVSQEHLDEMLAGIRADVGKPRLQPLAAVRPVDDEGEITPEFREAWEKNKRERIAAARAKFGTGGGS